VQTVDIVNSLPKIDFGIEKTNSKEVKLYDRIEEDEQNDLAAEPNQE
jgi:hypothetical protein